TPSCSRTTNKNHRTTTDPIRQSPPDRSEEELHDRVNADNRADGDSAGAVFPRVERQKRDDHAEADQIDEDGEEKNCERGTAHLAPRSLHVGRWPLADARMNG